MDITDLILEQHHEQRRLFALIQQIDGKDVPALEAVWERLRSLLDAHAESEERHFYPRLLKCGAGAADSKDAEDETRDAIKDHNDIRDTAKAVSDHRTGTDDWFQAVTKVDVTNSKHMSEEERQALADFRKHVSLDERHRLGVEFLAYVSNHLLGATAKDKDPSAYVREHEPAHAREEAEASG